MIVKPWAKTLDGRLKHPEPSQSTPIRAMTLIVCKRHGNSGSHLSCLPLPNGLPSAGIARRCAALFHQRPEGETATYRPVVEAPTSSGLAGVALNTGITSLANQPSCSRMIFVGVPHAARGDIHVFQARILFFHTFQNNR